MESEKEKGNFDMNDNDGNRMKGKIVCDGKIEGEIICDNKAEKEKSNENKANELMRDSSSKVTHDHNNKANKMMGNNPSQKEVYYKIIVVGSSCVGKTALTLRITDNEYSENFMTTIGVDFRLLSYEINGVRVNARIWDSCGQERFKSINTLYYRDCHAIILVYDITCLESFNDIETWMKDILEVNPSILSSSSFPLLLSSSSPLPSSSSSLSSPSSPSSLSSLSPSSLSSLSSLSLSSPSSPPSSSLSADKKDIELKDKNEASKNEHKINIPLLLIGNKSDLEHYRQVSKEEGKNLAKKLGADFIEVSAKTASGVKEAFDYIMSKIYLSYISPELRSITVGFPETADKDSIEFDDDIISIEKIDIAKDNANNQSYFSYYCCWQ